MIKWLGSLSLTIPLLIATALLVAVATFLEGSTGSHRLAEGWIYHHPLFYCLLSLYFVNILISALLRWPFKTRHVPFLLTHLGLLMVILGVAAKGFFGLQGVMRVHEGEGSHLMIIPHQLGLFGSTGKWRFSYQITPGVSFQDGELIFTPLEILPHGEKYFGGLDAGETPKEIVVFDGGRAGYGIEKESRIIPVTLEVKELPPPQAIEEARPILRLQIQKGDEKMEKLLPFEAEGGGLSVPVFGTLLKFQPIIVKIPHHLHLHQAKTLYRPGTSIPEAYEAKVIIDNIPFTLTMNQVFESDLGYRFYLSNIYGERGEVKEVHLAVNYDPTKYMLTYPGGGLVVLGALLLLLMRRK